MSEQIILAGAALTGLAIVTFAIAHCWQGWLAFKQHELQSRTATPDRSHERAGSPEGMARIELADLKERIRKLEAIASGVEL